MEIRINSILELIEVNKLFIINNQEKDEVFVLESIIYVNKYPINEMDDRACRIIKGVKIYADEVGDTGEEIIREWVFKSKKRIYRISEDCDLDKYNIRSIDKNHPRWDRTLVNNKIFNYICALFKI